MNQENIDAIIQFIRDNLDKYGAWSDFVEAMRLAFPLRKEAAAPARDSDRWALLPGLCCQAVGGDPDSTKEISAAWLILYSAAHIVDSVEDGDLSSEVSAIGGPALAINVANGLFLSASLILSELHKEDLPTALVTKINADFFNTILVMTSGQHHDLVNRQITLNQWWRVAEAKSGSFFSLACRCGAQVGIEDEQKIQAYSDYGFHLGLMLQVHDDLEDFQSILTTGESILPDKIQKSLAVAYSLDVLPPSDKLRLGELTGAGDSQPEVGEKVVELLNKCGAGLYMLAALQKQEDLGLAALHEACPLSPAGDELEAFMRTLNINNASF